MACGQNPPVGSSPPGLGAPPELRVMVKAKRWAGVLRYAKEELNRSPSEPRLHYWRGVAEFYLGDFVQAVMAFRSAQRLGLDSAPLHDALGMAYYSIHQYVLFLEQMRQAIAADPSDAAAYHYLGRYYELKVNNYPLALSYFEKALQRSPENVQSLHFRAFCLHMMGQRAEARAAYETAIRVMEARREPFGWTYQKLAELLQNADPPSALEYARKAVEVDPGIDSSHLMLGKMYESTGNLAGAIEEYRKAERLKPNDSSVRYVLFRLYRNQGDTQAAAAELKMHQKLRQVYGPQQ